MRATILTICLLLTAACYGQRVIMVRAGNATSLLAALEEANKVNAKKDAERLYILIPDGFYDLGEKTLTRLSGHNIALVGQSTDGTIIRNAPDYHKEGISTTAVLQNRGWGNYLQDLTLRNDLDYYSSEPDGRAVTLQDKGTRTICNRVRMLSYQDTYYSDNEKSQNYMLDSEIHGTIDFICGAGDVWFERCRIVTEKRTIEGTGNNIIMAPRTSETKWGYVFNNCTIENDISEYYYGRSWHTNPRCVWMNTTLLTPEKLLPTRFDPEGMKISSNYFKEWHTMDASGRDITPKTNVVTFTLRDKSNPIDLETIMTREEYESYKIDSIFTEWHPTQRLQQIETQAKELKDRFDQQMVLNVEKGSTESLLAAITQANIYNTEKDAERLYIIIPDGTYDLGEKTLTRITGHNIAIIGQSMTGTIIRNKPDVKDEGLSKTAIFQNRGEGNIFQDLTLENALDYYGAGAAGRAVTLHDKGTHTICNRVRMLSYQDTYYSDSEQGRHYFQDCEIHGTVDFICGAGDVWFEGCRLVTEKRTPDGSGRNVIAAPRTKGTEWGYIFNGCTIENRVSNFQYARAWHSQPRCTWLNTTLLTPERLLPTRFDDNGMRSTDLIFSEWGTKDANGRDITPKTNIVTFKAKDQQPVARETIISKREASSIKLERVFSDWNPKQIITKVENAARLIKD